MKFRNETQGRCIEMLVLTIRDTRSSRGVPAPCEPYSSSSMIAMLSRCTTYADAGGALYDATRGHTFIDNQSGIKTVRERESRLSRAVSVDEPENCDT